MSKKVKTDKININRELAIKQIVDFILIFSSMCTIFYFVHFYDYAGLELGTLLGVILLALSLIFYLEKSFIKRKLNKVINASSEITAKEIANIYEKNNSQKENNNISSNKIESIKQIVENLRNRSANMNEVTGNTKEKTDQSLNYTNNEYGAVKTNIEKMFSIRHKIQTIAELILELSDFVQSISSTIGLVEDIAEQTNLLALNAAVEAARAGEHGKGFAVVASEIRKLADESKQATTKIISLINDIQQTANSTVLATEEGTKEIESGLELAHVISENIEKLIQVMNEISGSMQEIITSSKQINEDSNSANDYVQEISTIIETNRQIAKENEVIFDEIESASNNLKKSIG